MRMGGSTRAGAALGLSCEGRFGKHAHLGRVGGGKGGICITILRSEKSGRQGML